MAPLFQRWIPSALLVCAAVGILEFGRWRGPTILTLWGSHGVDIGDLPAVPLLALALAVAVRGLPVRGGPVPALALGALLFLAGIAGEDVGGPLVPAGGGTFDHLTQRTSAQHSEPVNDWSHIALTYDGQKLRLFLNGKEVSSRDAKGTIVRTSGPLWMGGSHPYGEFFRGLIDDVRIYNRPLGVPELRREMARPVVRSHREEGLVGAYSFDARSRTRAVDSSGAGNAGVLRGPGWTSAGRFGGALRFDAAHELVRVPASPSLNLGRGMTLAAWIRPSEPQRGWRTILHRQTDVYFLMAGSPRENGAGPLDDLPAVLFGAAVLLTVVLATDRWRRVRAPRSRWWPAITLFMIGSVVDAALTPSGALIGPLLVTVWLALTASSSREAHAGWLIAATFGALTAASLAGVVGELGRNDGSDARALALLLAALFAVMGRARGWAETRGLRNV